MKTTITNLLSLSFQSICLMSLVSCSGDITKDGTVIENSIVRGNISLAADPLARAGNFSPLSDVIVTIFSDIARTNDNGDFSVSTNPKEVGETTISIGDPVNNNFTIDLPGGNVTITLAIQQEIDGTSTMSVLLMEEGDSTKSVSEVLIENEIIISSETNDSDLTSL